MNNNVMKLSVIIPVFNCEKYLQRCLDSLINQSLKNIQIIVVNDASTDKTNNILKEYTNIYSNVTEIKNSDNKGAGYSRNIGLKYANGEYVAFLDADDWIDTNAYFDMISALDASSADLAICGIRTEYSSAYCSSERYTYLNKNIISGNFALHLLCHTNAQDIYISPMPGNKVMRSNFIKKHNLLFPERSFCEDDEYFYKALFYANKIVIVPHVVQHYFQRENSSMHAFSIKHIDDFVQCFKEIKDFSLNIDNEEIISDYYSFFRKCIVSLLNSLFSSEQNINSQRYYLKYLYEQITNSFSITEFIDYVDIMEIKKILL